ncbi:MAG: hypothetical protein C0392_12415 [Syntrophus sp. (in: bacteria)]|nr:hypothetical protein [Syntrophus sp. (in: bacteria)]
MRFIAILLVVLSLLSCTKVQEIPVKQKSAEGEAADVMYKKEMEEIKKSLKGDTRTKLKRDGKGMYTWEITGKDTQEVLKANELLRKRLGEAQ